MEWINPRSGGLPDVLKTRLGRIAYFGTSVTVQKHGYRPALHLKLVQHFNRPHLPINAGIGGIGITGGVFLMDDLVIARRPDFCLVEFSTADYSGSLPLAESSAALEGALRKLAAPQCPACLLHLYRDDTDYSQTPPVVAAFDEVAAHYGVPSLHVGAYLAGEFAAGRLEKAATLKDIVHLSAQGAEHVAETVFGGLMRVRESAPQPVSPTPAPLHPNHYQYTANLPAASAMLTGSGPHSLGRFGDRYDFVQVGKGQEITVECDDMLIGMLVIVGPDSGVVEVSGQRFQLWDRWCIYDRLQTVMFWPQFPPGIPAHVRLTGEPVDYTASRDPAFAGFKGDKSLKVIGFLVRK